MPLINRALGGVAQLPLYTGSHVIYGDWKQGWIEMLTSGVLTVKRSLARRGLDIYLLETGESGEASLWKQGSYALGGSGGKGGDWIEHYGVALSGSYDVLIGAVTTLGSYTTEGQSNGKAGGTRTISSAPVTKYTAHKGTDGRIPFSGHSPLSGGYAKLKLGPGGGEGGGYYQLGTDPDDPNGYPQYLHETGGGYGGSAVKNGAGVTNTGAGGNGGTAPDNPSNYDYGRSIPGGAGGSGIAIMRWGY